MSFQTQVLLVPSLWIYPSWSGSLLPGSGSDYPLLLQMAMRPPCPREAKSCGQPTWGVKCPKYFNPSTPMGLLLLEMPVLGLREKAVSNEVNTASCPQLFQSHVSFTWKAGSYLPSGLFYHPCRLLWPHLWALWSPTGSRVGGQRSKPRGTPG